MSINQIGLNIKKGIIKCLKTGKLIYLITVTIVMFLVVSGDLAEAIGGLAKSKDVKDGLLKYNDYANIIRRIVPNIYVRWILVCTVIVIWMLVWYFHYCYEEPVKKLKKIVHILGHSTLGKTQLKLNEESLKILELNVEELDLIEDIKIIKGNYNMLQSVVTKQDNYIEKFKNKINNTDKYGYMGISHTPLILRAGYEIGDETKFALFHKKRNVDYYEELNISDIYTPIKIEKKSVKDNCRELIVAISTTFIIEDNQLNILHPENKSIIKFKTDELGFDVITSEKQVENYVSYILREIRQIRSNKGITKIHMVISSSVAFTFALGQGLSNHYDPEVIIYHFDLNNPKKYPWGISLFKDSMNCIVVN